ncbi:hypothetical protein LK996_15095 [Lysobacter sp. A6]|uniref:Uncharacterized protein n=1 Tax=Noviluteimonas lactosilytica TaxID=2888523 RepID=A0ABS8JLB3_9GAMM|nr:hypothetical protein [Lysobacter lactosilyticus]MCC8364397.1 hypothetical protein [Lysobacter lactosilyticus]
MATSLLERLPRIVAHGRRQAQRLVDSTHGRQRERAVPVEWIDVPGDAATDTGAPSRRVLCGVPALSVAALLAEQRECRAPRIGRVVVDLHPACDGDALPARLARWAPCLALLRKVAPSAALALRVAPDEASIVQLVLDAYTLRDTDVEPHADATTLLLAEDASRLPALASETKTTTKDAHWIACVRDATACAALRRSLLLRGDTRFRIDAVGATPAEWMRRNAAAQPLAAMHAALVAYGAKPLVETASMATPTGRRRAGADVVLGEVRRDGERTLVWVDAPDRRTGEATVCRAITRREHGRYDRVVVLGWHVAPLLGQQLAGRGDLRVEVQAIRCLPRAERGPVLRIDPRGFAPIDGLARACVDRRRSRSAPDFEWVNVQLGDDFGEPVVDWSIDPAHDGDVFRGAWHALRDGEPGARSVSLRLPRHDGPRRVCVRALGADGRASELLYVVLC